eukprot:scaffold24893_cov105-Phaeocystis_antarctica.AAC.2
MAAAISIVMSSSFAQRASTPPPSSSHAATAGASPLSAARYMATGNSSLAISVFPGETFA